MSIQTIDPASRDPTGRDQAIQSLEACSFQLPHLLWTLGMCALSVSLTPLVAFYMLLVT
jgi:hypothetical protein